MCNKIKLRGIEERDFDIISEAFKRQGWNKPSEQYKEYHLEMKEGKREVIIAEYNGEFSGYVTIQWSSNYDFFNKNRIPEIKDLNVLIDFRRKGIASTLMDEAEKRIGEKSNYSGLGVGLYEGYGFAHNLYIKRGYLPDGKGLCYQDKTMSYGEKAILDDDLCLILTKKLY